MFRTLAASEIQDAGQFWVHHLMPVLHAVFVLVKVKIEPNPGLIDLQAGQRLCLRLPLEVESRAWAQQLSCLHPELSTSAAFREQSPDDALIQQANCILHCRRLGALCELLLRGQ